MQESSPTTISNVSVHDSGKTHSFINSENELKRTCNDKDMTSSHTTSPTAANDEEVETE